MDSHLEGDFKVDSHLEWDVKVDSHLERDFKMLTKCLHIGFRTQKFQFF